MARKPTSSNSRKAAGGSPGRAKGSKTSTKVQTGRVPAPKRSSSSRPAARPGEIRGSTVLPMPHLAAVPPETTAAEASGDNAVPRGGSGLSAKDLEQFREMLLEKRRELVGDVGRLQDEALSRNRREATGDLSSMPIHMADLGTDNYEQEFTLGLIEGERALLREIDEALTRIEKGTYGVCLATGQPIGKARLKATPWAKYCYEYMLAQEKRQRRGI